MKIAQTVKEVASFNSVIFHASESFNPVTITEETAIFVNVQENKKEAETMVCLR